MGDHMKKRNSGGGEGQKYYFVQTGWYNQRVRRRSHGQGGKLDNVYGHLSKWWQGSRERRPQRRKWKIERVPQL